MVEVLTDVRLNLKREIIDPTDCEGALCAETRPWATLGDFTSARNGLEAWKKPQRRVLKTSADLRNVLTWTANHEGLKISGSTAQSGRPPLVNAFLRGMVRNLLDAAWPHKRLADFLTDNGFTTRRRSQRWLEQGTAEPTLVKAPPRSSASGTVAFPSESFG